jgi:type VI secretion system protein ImpM
MTQTRHSGSAAVGFYGKLPARADFVGRRVSRDFVEQWDAWLQRGLAASEAALGADWLDCYYTAPLWRFVLPAGVCGSEPLVGVMMPSVDAVGRCFPFVLVLGSEHAADPLAVATGSSAWFEAAEALALETLSDGFDMAALDRTLSRLDPPPSLTPTYRKDASTKLASVWLELPMLSALASAAAQIAGVWPRPCLWWTTGSTRVRPGLAATAGLIESPHFAALFDGQWTRHGWCIPASARPASSAGDDAWDRDG